MNNLTPDVIRARKEEYTRTLSALNSSSKRGKWLFRIALGVGVTALVVAAAMWRPATGAIILAAVFLLLGVPGFILWRRAEGKIEKFQALLAELERAELFGQEFSSRTVRGTRPTDGI